MGNCKEFDELKQNNRFDAYIIVPVASIIFNLYCFMLTSQILVGEFIIFAGECPILVVVNSPGKISAPPHCVDGVVLADVSGSW